MSLIQREVVNDYDHFSIMRFYSSKKKIITVKQCVKSVQVWSFFWSIFSCIQSGYRKIRTRENPVFGYFSCSEKTCNSSLVGMGLPSPTNWLLHHWKLLNLSLLCNLRWPLLFEFHPNVLYHSPFQKCCEDVLLILFIANPSYLHYNYALSSYSVIPIFVKESSDVYT